jgi:SAM-dependent methyltransferase
MLLFCRMGPMTAAPLLALLLAALPNAEAQQRLRSHCQDKLNAICAADAPCASALGSTNLVATNAGPGKWRCVVHDRHHRNSNKGGGRFCTRNALALEYAIICSGNSKFNSKSLVPFVEKRSSPQIDNGGKPYVIVNLLGMEEWKNVKRSAQLPRWMREPRAFCSPATRQRLPDSNVLCDGILNHSTVSGCTKQDGGFFWTSTACAPFRLFLPTAKSGITGQRVEFQTGMIKWMESHSQLAPANQFISLMKSTPPGGNNGWRFLDNGCSLDGRQFQYMLAKLPGAFGVGVQVESDFPFVMEQQCERCALVKLRPEGESLPFRNDAFDGVLSVNVIEHAINAAQYVRESVRVLRKGGVFYATWAPTYGAHNGHHLNQGRGRGIQRMHKSAENYTDDLVPPYLHLALPRAKAAGVLADAVGTNPEMIEDMLRFMYDDMHISRLGMHVVKDELDSLVATGSIRIEHFACDRPPQYALTPKLQKLVLARNPTLRADDLNALGCAFIVRKL